MRSGQHRYPEIRAAKGDVTADLGRRGDVDLRSVGLKDPDAIARPRIFILIRLEFGKDIQGRRREPLRSAAPRPDIPGPLV